MATLPLKYCEYILEGLRYVDSVKKYNTEVFVDYTEISNEKYYDIYHYDTFIARLYPSSNVICLFGGWSRSDCDIINSFIILLNMSGSVHTHKGEIYFDDDKDVLRLKKYTTKEFVEEVLHISKDDENYKFIQKII